MSLENTWVGYISRSYVDIKQSLISRLKVLMTEITDYTESNIVIVILDSMAGLMEQLHFYIDTKARESYIATARRYTSIIKLTRVLDYRVKASSPSYIDLLIQTLNADGTPFNVFTPVSIPKGTKFITSSGVPFISTKDGIIKSGTNSTTVLAQQMDKVTNSVMGITSGVSGQRITLPSHYMDDTLEVFLNGIAWVRKDTFGFSSPYDNHFTVSINEDKVIELVFGNSIHGKIPPTNQNVVCTYYITKGTLGRVSENEISLWVSTPPVLSNNGTAVTVNVSNPIATVGGTDIQGIEDIRTEAPLSIRTREVAITTQDFIDLALLVPGVDKSGAQFTSDKGLQLFIAPVGGGTANAALLLAVLTYFTDKMMLPFTPAALNVLPAGELLMVLNISITGKFRKTESEIRSEVMDVLLNSNPFASMGINGIVKLSDITSVIQGLSTVDYLYLDKVYAIPYPRATNSSVIMNWEFDVFPNLNETHNWTLYFNNPDFQLFKDGAYVMSFNPGDGVDLSSTEGFSFYVENGAYPTAATYEFTTYPVGKNVVVTDNTVPVVKLDSITLNITEVF
jgi:hypothetical protein